MKEYRAIAIAAVALFTILGVAGYLTFRDVESSTTSSPEPTRAKGAATDEQTLRVPRCPIELRLGPSFDRVPTEHRSPNIRLRSTTRSLELTVACRQADEDFEADVFLDETFQAVNRRFEGKIAERTRIDAPKNQGWSTFLSKNGQLRYFNVLVHDRYIATVNVTGPTNEATRTFNSQLVVQRLKWVD